MKIVDKPWGRELWLQVNDKYALKLLEVNEGHELSLQYHEKKMETWYVNKGSGRVNYNGNKFVMREGDVLHITPLDFHTVKALEDLQILEVSTPELDDIVRLSDKYGRCEEYDI